MDDPKKNDEYGQEVRRKYGLPDGCSWEAVVTHIEANRGLTHEADRVAFGLLVDLLREMDEAWDEYIEDDDITVPAAVIGKIRAVLDGL